MGNRYSDASFLTINNASFKVINESIVWSLDISHLSEKEFNGKLQLYVDSMLFGEFNLKGGIVRTTIGIEKRYSDYNSIANFIKILNHDLYICDSYYFKKCTTFTFTYENSQDLFFNLEIVEANLKVYRKDTDKNKIIFEWSLDINNTKSNTYKNLFIKFNNIAIKQYFNIEHDEYSKNIIIKKEIEDIDFKIKKIKKEYILKICHGENNSKKFKKYIYCHVYADAVISKWISNDQHRIQLIGTSSSGKSSFINSIHVSVTGNDIIPANINENAISETKHLRGYTFKDSKDSIFPFMIYDSCGIEQNSYLTFDLLKDIIDGNIKDGTNLENIHENQPEPVNIFKKRSVLIFIVKYSITDDENKIAIFSDLIKKLKNIYSKLSIIILVSHLNDLSPSINDDPFNYENKIDIALNNIKNKLKASLIYPCINNTIFPKPNGDERVDKFEINLYNLWLLDLILGQSSTNIE